MLSKVSRSIRSVHIQFMLRIAKRCRAYWMSYTLYKLGFAPEVKLREHNTEYFHLIVFDIIQDDGDLRSRCTLDRR